VCADVFGCIAKDLFATTTVTSRSEKFEYFGCCNFDGFLGDGIVPSIDGCVVCCVGDGGYTAVDLAPLLDWAKDGVCGLDLGSCFHFLAALLVNVCDGYVFGDGVEVGLVGIDGDASCRVGEFYISKDKDLGFSSFLYFEVLAASVRKEECGNYEDGGKSQSASVVLGSVRIIVHVDEMFGCNGFLPLYWWVDVGPSL
jgi:hypothetical protein